MTKSTTEIIDKLHSQGLVDQISGLEDLKALVSRLLDEAAKTLLVSTGRYSVAEKIFAIGPAMIPPLEKLLLINGNEEAATYAALILLKLGSKVGIPQLLKSLRGRVGPVGMIAQSLSTAGAPETSETIAHVLSEWPIDKDPYTAVTLVTSLRKLNTPVPKEALEKLEAASPAIRQLL